MTGYQTHLKLTSSDTMNTLDAFSRSAAFLLFILLVAVHAISVYYVGGTQFIFAVLWFGVCVTSFYLLFLFFLGDSLAHIFDRLHDKLAVIKRKNILTVIDIIVVVFPAFYFVMVGKIPVIEMLNTKDYIRSSGIRHAFFYDLPTYLRYSGEYYIRAVVPVWIVYCYVAQRRALLPVIFAGSFFAFAIVTKSTLIIALLPLLIFLVCRGKLLLGVLLIAWISALIIASVVAQQKSDLLIAPQNTISGPANKDVNSPPFGENSGVDYDHQKREVSVGEAIIAFIYKPVEAIGIRALTVPGLVEKQWLETYSEKTMLEGGCGYRWFAPFVPCTFVNLANKVWLKYYPDLAKEGLDGTVTAADYIQAYANFGLIGVFISSFLMAVILILLRAIFHDPVLNLAFNTVPLALSFESVLTTLLNTGGWGLTILMVLILFDRRRDVTAATRSC